MEGRNRGQKESRGTRGGVEREKMKKGRWKTIMMMEQKNGSGEGEEEKGDEKQNDDIFHNKHSNMTDLCLV